jgi:hypothetical protein
MLIYLSIYHYLSIYNFANIYIFKYLMFHSKFNGSGTAALGGNYCYGRWLSRRTNSVILSFWQYINRLVDECNLHREIQRSLKAIRPQFAPGYEYRVNNEISHNFIYFNMVNFTRALFHFNNINYIL